MPVRMIYCVCFLACLLFTRVEGHAGTTDQSPVQYSDWDTRQCVYEGDRNSLQAWRKALLLTDVIDAMERDGILYPILFDDLHAIRKQAGGILADARSSDQMEKARGWAQDLMRGAAGPIYRLAKCHQAGISPLPADDGFYNLLMYEAARKGHVPAAWALRVHYQDENGYPIRRGGVLLRELYRVAARAGVVEAQIAMGYLTLGKSWFSSSQAVDASVAIAYEWFLLARKNGADVSNMIAVLEQKFDPHQAAYQRRRIETENKIP